MGVDYSNLAKNPELYVDISNLAKEAHHASFNLSDLSRIEQDAGKVTEDVVEAETPTPSEEPAA